MPKKSILDTGMEITALTSQLRLPGAKKKKNKLFYLPVFLDRFSDTGVIFWSRPTASLGYHELKYIWL